MDKRFEYYKEQYYFELARKNDLSTSLTIPIGFLTVLSAGYAFILLNLPEWESFYLQIIFTICIIISFIFVITALYNLYFSIHGQKYGYTPTPNKLYDYETKYSKYLDDITNKDEKILDEKFFLHLKKSLVSTTNNNREKNIIRAEKIRKASVYTMYAIFLFIISTIPFIINKYL